MLDPDEIEDADKGADEAEAALKAAAEEQSAETMPPEHEMDENPPEFDVRPKEERESRRERRQNRFREANERADRAERELQDARAREQQLMGVLQQRQQQPEQPQRRARDPHQDAVDQAYREQQLLAQEVAARTNLTQEETSKYEQRIRDAHERYIDAKLAQREANQPRQSNVPDPGAMTRQMYAIQNPDVFGNDRARNYAEAHWRMMVAKGASNTDPAVFNEALDAARREILGKDTTPSRPRTDADRRRYASSGRGHAGRGAGDRRRGTVTMTKADRRMADALYSNITNEKQRYQKFAEEVKRDLDD
jgi:hypothetical protein